MAKFKIQANADIDLLTKDEVHEVFAGWMAELARGIKWRNFTARDTTAVGTYTIGLDGSDALGPAPGFVWSVLRVYISGLGVTAGTDAYSVFTNDNSPTMLVRSGLTRGGEWGPGGFVLNGGDRLVIAGATTGTANADIVLSGQAIEMPVQLAYQLL